LIKAGDILIAKPFLQDGHFKRSVIYLCDNNQEGSLGFMMNKPIGMMLGDLFPHLKNADFPLFEGGPVSPNQLFYTHTLGEKLSESQHVIDDVYWGGNFFELSKLIEDGNVSLTQIRFYIGYSGWSNGQLEEELKNKMWFTNAENHLTLLEKKPEDLWGIELTKINSSYKVFSDYPYDPSLN
jgi:putative transcriptional regulator